MGDAEQQVGRRQTGQSLEVDQRVRILFYDCSYLRCQGNSLRLQWQGRACVEAVQAHTHLALYQDDWSHSHPCCLSFGPRVPVESSLAPTLLRITLHAFLGTCPSLPLTVEARKPLST